MIRRLVNGRLFAIALLVVVQAGVTLHLADHGPGHHEQGDVPCLLSAANDDDGFAPPPTAAHHQIVSASAAVLTEEPILVLPESGIRLPPATGPPPSI